MATDDLSPTLGGERAPEPPLPPPPPPERPAPNRGGPRETVEEDPIAALFGASGPLDFGRIAALFTDDRARPTSGRADGQGASGRGGDPPHATEEFVREIEGFFNSAAQIFQERMPPALAAFEGLVDAMERALDPLINEPRPPQDPPHPPSP